MDEQWQSKDGWQWNGEWQWQGGSGTNRFARSVRFEWWWLERGSGSIGRVAVVLDNIIKWQWMSVKDGSVCEWQWQGGSGTRRSMQF
jgi:hypothetical protein